MKWARKVGLRFHNKHESTEAHKEFMAFRSCISSKSLCYHYNEDFRIKKSYLQIYPFLQKLSNAYQKPTSRVESCVLRSAKIIFPERKQIILPLDKKKGCVTLDHSTKALLPNLVFSSHWGQTSEWELLAFVVPLVRHLPRSARFAKYQDWLPRILHLNLHRVRRSESERARRAKAASRRPVALIASCPNVCPTSRNF